MATIRTQVVNGVTRILTKTTGGVQRVSCSCCAAEEEGCCMYPADQVGVLFGSADLPDEVYLFFSVGGVVLFDGNLTKNGSSYESGTVTLSIEDNLIWRLSNSEDSRFGYGRRCLFNEAFPYDPQSDEMGFTVSIQDNFADTYEVTYVEGELSATGTISRTGLCTWSGSVSLGEGIERSINLNYNSTDIRGTSNQYKWTLDNFFLLRTKDGFQNTPVGSYTADGLETWTLQEV